jgi:hypothetical protein
MLGRPWCFCWRVHQGFSFSKVTFPTVFFVWCRCLNGCFFRCSGFFGLSYTVEKFIDAL